MHKFVPMRTKKVILLVQLLCTILVSLFLFPTIANAQVSGPKEQEEWNALATTIVKEVEAGKYLVARERLEKLAHQFSQSNFANKNLSVQAIQSLSTTIIDLEERLNRITPNQSELDYYAKRLLIAFDVVDHSYQPLWKSYYPIMKKETEQVITDLRKQKNVQEDLNTLQNTYVLIRPALVVVKSPTTVNKVDSLFLFLQHDQSITNKFSAVKQLNNLLYPLFYGSEQDVLAAINPTGKVPISIFLILLSIIIIGILGYVSWRKRIESSTT